MPYETRSVFIVKHKDDETIYKVFGVLREAERYNAKVEDCVVDEWPCEFLVEKKNA